MKKLTAGIFATLLTMVSVDGAYAAIASKGYVDEQVGTVSTEVDTLSTTVGLHTAQITNKADKATTLAGYGITDGATKTELTNGLAGKVDNADITDMQVKANLTTNAEWSTEKSADDKYPSNAAVDAAITSATTGLANESTITEIKGDITEIQGDVTELQTDVSAKQDKNMGAGAANHIVTTDGEGNITSSATITNTQVSGLGTLATKSTVGTAEIEDNAVTTAKIGDRQVTAAKIATGVVPTVTTSIVTGNTDAAQAGAVADALAAKADAADLDDYVTETEANAAYAVKTLEDQVGSVSAENMGTTATTVVTAIKEVAGEAAAAQSTASSANTAAGAAQKAAEAAQATADGAIPKPDGECSNPANKCVLTWNNSAYAWEVIERGTSESSN